MFHVIVGLPGTGKSTAARFLEDLKGKRLGFNSDGSVTHLATLSFVKLMGWDPNQDISL